MNTILYTVVGTVFNLITITCAAYPLSKKRLRGRSRSVAQRKGWERLAGTGPKKQQRMYETV